MHSSPCAVLCQNLPEGIPALWCRSRGWRGPSVTKLGDTGDPDTEPLQVGPEMAKRPVSPGFKSDLKEPDTPPPRKWHSEQDLKWSDIRASSFWGVWPFRYTGSVLQIQVWILFPCPSWILTTVLDSGSRSRSGPPPRQIRPLTLNPGSESGSEAPGSEAPALCQWRFYKISLQSCLRRARSDSRVRPIIT